MNSITGNTAELQQFQKLIANGDEGAFRKLFDLYFCNLSQFVFSFVKTRDVSTEIVDGVFIRLWHNRSSIDQIDNLRVYLYKAAKNAALNYISRHARKNILEPFDDITIQLKDESSPEGLLITKEMLQKIRETVDLLPPRCKMIFKLIREDGLKYKEVAEILNISVKTVDAQMVIAVSRVRELMSNHLNLPSVLPKKNMENL
ncbi:MAG: RNA polymerase sigma-70 factor [Sphingobacteriia bacterium]|nr:RNA polymerase sigma-70 factor [Sphingobacteriia bacterium]